MSSSSQQRQRHGVRKKIVEGIGGVLVGAALVLFLRGLTKRRTVDKSIILTDSGSATQTTPGDTV